MKLHSNWAAAPIIVLYAIALGLIVTDLVMWIGLEGGIKIIGIPIPFQLTVIALGLFFFVKSLGASVLKYSDDGAVMEFYIERPLLKFVNGDYIKRYDFPKEKLVNYRFKKKGLSKYIVLKLTRGDKGFKRANIPITFLLKEEKELLLESINSILEKNKNGEQQFRSR